MRCYFPCCGSYRGPFFSHGILMPWRSLLQRRGSLGCSCSCITSLQVAILWFPLLLMVRLLPMMRHVLFLLLVTIQNLIAMWCWCALNLVNLLLMVWLLLPLVMPHVFFLLIVTSQIAMLWLLLRMLHVIFLL